MKDLSFLFGKPTPVRAVGSPSVRDERQTDNPGANAAEPSRIYSLGALAAAIYLTFAILVGSADIFYILRHYTRFPFGDHWIWLERFYRNGLLATLYAQFNEHRLVIPGLWYFLDHRYFGGTNTFLVLLMVLMQIGCIILAILPVCRQTDVPRPVRFVFAGFVTITMLWFIQAEDFFYPYQICIVCCNLGILGTLHLFARFVERTRQPRSLVWVGIGMLACALWANFSNGHGILVWPVLLAVGLLLRLPARWLSLVLLVMLCALGIYFFHYRTPTQHASPLESLQHPIWVMHYVVLMVGLPFFGAGTQDISLSSHVGSYVVSIFGILLAVVLLLRFAKTKAVQRSREQVIYCSLILLCLGACFITALGRSRFPLWQALSGRYAPVPLLFWISLIALITGYLCAWEVRGGLGRAVWCALLMMASMATLSTQALLGQYMAGRERQQAAAALSITVGVPDLARIGEELSGQFDRIRFVDRAAMPFLGHSMFWRPQAAVLGTPLLDHFQLVPANECLGFVDTVNLLPEPASKGARLLGWAWDGRQRSEINGIWVVDDRNVIRGLGITGLSRPDVAATHSNYAMESAGWVAYSQLPAQGSDALTVFAGLRGGKSVCQIGTSRAPAPQGGGSSRYDWRGINEPEAVWVRRRRGSWLPSWRRGIRQPHSAQSPPA